MSDTKDTQDALSELSKQLKETFGENSTEFKRIIAIGLSIKNTGMSDEDCALLARVSPETLQGWREKYPIVSLYLKLKRIEYKSNLLEVLTLQATTNKDVKVATYLLERHFDQEFDPGVKKEEAKRKKDNPADDTLGQVISFVRKNAPPSPVNDTAAPSQTVDGAGVNTPGAGVNTPGAGINTPGAGINTLNTPEHSLNGASTTKSVADLSHLVKHG